MTEYLCRLELGKPGIHIIEHGIATESIFREQLLIRFADTLPLRGTQALLEIDVRAMPDPRSCHSGIVNIET